MSSIWQLEFSENKGKTWCDCDHNIMFVQEHMAIARAEELSGKNCIYRAVEYRRVDPGTALRHEHSAAIEKGKRGRK